jgi:hypothetical protein
MRNVIAFVLGISAAMAGPAVKLDGRWAATQLVEEFTSTIERLLGQQPDQGTGALAQR